MTKLSDKRILDIIRADGRYPVEAYVFLLNEGWPRALRQAYEEETAPPPASSSGKAPRHVSGKQICLALRDLAMEKWGLMAETVLKHWNITKSIDFGNMVYLLIQHDVMHKTEEDSVEDFRDVYSFAEAFGSPSQFDLKE
ncbi:MAG: hypothetical protein MUP47_08335 [Phycisphaerae bacterium]|nr:hypothetical protein [Phycisphaerae bacterium]